MFRERGFEFDDVDRDYIRIQSQFIAIREHYLLTKCSP
jgi:hypothetical protein